MAFFLRVPRKYTDLDLIVKMYQTRESRFYSVCRQNAHTLTHTSCSVTIYLDNTHANMLTLAYTKIRAVVDTDKFTKKQYCRCRSLKGTYICVRI